MVKLFRGKNAYVYVLVNTHYKRNYVHIYEDLLLFISQNVLNEVQKSCKNGSETSLDEIIALKYLNAKTRHSMIGSRKESKFKTVKEGKRDLQISLKDKG